jgi:hypothetical protein
LSGSPPDPAPPHDSSECLIELAALRRFLPGIRVPLHSVQFRRSALRSALPALGAWCSTGGTGSAGSRRTTRTLSGSLGGSRPYSSQWSNKTRASSACDARLRQSGGGQNQWRQPHIHNNQRPATREDATIKAPRLAAWRQPRVVHRLHPTIGRSVSRNPLHSHRER